MFETNKVADSTFGAAVKASIYTASKEKGDVDKQEERHDIYNNNMTEAMGAVIQGEAARKEFKVLRQRHRASLIIQRTLKSTHARKMFIAMHDATTVIQSDPDTEVIALSPTTLMATNRFVCEICNKGFQRDQNLQFHRRGHNLPWKLRKRTGIEVRERVYVCSEVSCVHHDPFRALGDLTGIKNIYVENTTKRNGNVTHVRRSMQFSMSGKLMPRLAGAGSISVIVAQFFQGEV